MYIIHIYTHTHTYNICIYMYKYNERSIQVRRTNIFLRRRELRTGASNANTSFFYLSNDLLKRKIRIRYIERSTNFLLT